MTVFFWALHILGFMSVVLAVLRGGHAERFGAAVLLLNQLTVPFYEGWSIGQFEPGTAIDDAVLTLIFIAMAVRSSRWWPLVAAAALALCVVVHGLTLLTPITQYASVSARIGLWTVIHLALLAGVVERWLAGETAVSDTAVWRRRRRAP